MTDPALSRGDLLVKAALAVGATYGVGAVGPYVRRALGAGEGDAAVLNFLLRFEYLQVDLYGRGLDELELKDGRRELVERLAADERQHVEALTESLEALGGKPVAKGDYSFAFRDFEGFLGLASSLEHSAIGAFNGAIPSFESKKVLALAASIVQVEGRHAAKILLERGEAPAPEAFDQPLTEYRAVSSVEKYTGVF